MDLRQRCVADPAPSHHLPSAGIQIGSADLSRFRDIAMPSNGALRLANATIWGNSPDGSANFSQLIRSRSVGRRATALNR